MLQKFRKYMDKTRTEYAGIIATAHKTPWCTLWLITTLVLLLTTFRQDTKEVYTIPFIGFIQVLPIPFREHWLAYKTQHCSLTSMAANHSNEEPVTFSPLTCVRGKYHFTLKPISTT